jgi:S1-C subfamily serine protease
VEQVWLCTSCGRRVPGRIAACRCGFARPEPVTGGVVETAPADAPQAGFRHKSALLLGALTVILAAVGYSSVRQIVADQAAQTRFETQTLAAASERATAGDARFAPVDVTPDVEPASDSPLAPETESETTPGASDSLEDVVSRVLPAVAAIEAGNSRGTGFFIRPDQVVTNAHVVEGQSSVRLQVGKAHYTARVVRISNGTDLALLQVYNADPNQPTLRLGSASSARVGQEVVAVGSALGVLSNTVTRGIVSAVRKAGSVTLIQTDAAINPGNSGGPLVNRAGEVIGINSIGFSRAQGLAFAVAVDHTAPLVEGRVDPSAQTPLGELRNAMSGSSAPDQERLTGERDYAGVLQWAEGRANQLDGLWNRYAASCVSTAVKTGDRPWFAVLEPNGVSMTRVSNVDCESWFETVTTNARPIYDEVARATETARRSGVYPGTLRDLRRRYRMEWGGWGR